MNWESGFPAVEHSAPPRKDMSRLKVVNGDWRGGEEEGRDRKEMVTGIVRGLFGFGKGREVWMMRKLMLEGLIASAEGE